MNRGLRSGLAAVGLACAPAAQATTYATLTFGGDAFGTITKLVGPPTYYNSYTGPGYFTFSFSIIFYDDGTRSTPCSFNTFCGGSSTPTSINFVQRGVNAPTSDDNVYLCFRSPLTAPTATINLDVDPSCSGGTFQSGTTALGIMGTITKVGFAYLTVASAATGGQGPVVTFVPEPASWAMMLVGFAASGMALRRRHSPAAISSSSA